MIKYVGIITGTYMTDRNLYINGKIHIISEAPEDYKIEGMLLVDWHKFCAWLTELESSQLLSLKEILHCFEKQYRPITWRKV